MSLVASQIAGLTIVYWTACSGADQRKYQSSASLVFVRGIHRFWPNIQQWNELSYKVNRRDIDYLNSLNLLPWLPREDVQIPNMGSFKIDRIYPHSMKGRFTTYSIDCFDWCGHQRRRYFFHRKAILRISKTEYKMIRLLLQKLGLKDCPLPRCIEMLIEI